MSVQPVPATLEPVHFAEFLRDRALITEEQWLAALAAHWSAPVHRPVGAAIVDCGFLARDAVEAAARMFHDELEVVELGPADLDVIELDVPRYRPREKRAEG
jgi:hypothetical protein